MTFGSCRRPTVLVLEGFARKFCGFITVLDKDVPPDANFSRVRNKDPLHDSGFCGSRTEISCFLKVLERDLLQDTGFQGPGRRSATSDCFT